MNHNVQHLKKQIAKVDFKIIRSSTRFNHVLWMLMHHHDSRVVIFCEWYFQFQLNVINVCTEYYIQEYSTSFAG